MENLDVACRDLSTGVEFGPGYTNPLLKVNLCFGVKETQKSLQRESQLRTAPKKGGGKCPVSHILLEEGFMLARNLYFGQCQSLLSHAKATPLR